jgi:demethoxyubiquinone hydroxylase (CLK1/Coq7/Cat5 family)
METQNWLTYFEVNKTNVLQIEKDPHNLSNQERQRITKSIQSFQLGESSEGHILRQQARVQSEQMDRPEYLLAIEHLIREENRHSSYLGQFMNQHEIPKMKRGWNDACFRFLRRLAGVELSTRVLVTAEVIAMTYYDCLAVATESKVLRTICQRMCEEEQIHVAFQMHHIHEINFKKYALASAVSNILHFLLLGVTVFAVWYEHKEVLESKYDFKSFRSKVFEDFKECTYKGQRSAALALAEAGFFSKEALCF